MKKQTKNILAVAGLIGTILGIILAVPSFSARKILSSNRSDSTCSWRLSSFSNSIR